MRYRSILILALAVQFGCGGCDEADPDTADSGVQTPGDTDGVDDANQDDAGNDGDTDTADAGDDANLDAGPDDAEPDAGTDSGGADVGNMDASMSDGEAPDLPPPSTCGDGSVDGAEACDDGNTMDGDYCDATCTSVTGSCGDGVVQGNETCDDATTVDCVGTHDGGDGACVPAGTCSSGYVFANGQCVTNTTGLSVPCQNGTGYTLFRYHYSNNSTSAQIDVWDASCSYSFAPGSACNVYEICPGFCDPDVTSAGYPIFDSSDYMRVRFNVNGLNFTQATLYIQARSYATSSSTNVEVWSPLYGGYAAGPIDNDFVYDWYGFDWTGYLYPSDDPNLTAIQLYGSGGRVAIKAVEMCVE